MSDKPPVYPEEFLRKYEVERVLGEGGVGRVVLARDRELERKVAVKFLLDGAFATKADLDRFAEEARVCGNLNHPNIVPLYSIGAEDTRTPYLVFAYVDGFDISQRIKDRKYLSIDETVSWFCQVLGGLTHAHERGIIHRDIKPNNVRINGDGQAMIMDFGMAKAKSGRAFQTRVGLVLGTPLYIAPEVLRGQPATPVSDVYSVACSLYECLSGRPPHIAEDPMKVLEMQLKVEPELVENLRPDAPKALCEVVTRALSKKPELRHQSADELSMALKRALNPQRSDPSLRRIGQSKPRGTTGKNQRVTARGVPVATIAYEMPARPGYLKAAAVGMLLMSVAIGLGVVAWQRRLPPDLGSVKVAIDARGLDVSWARSPGVPVKIELAAPNAEAASEVKEIPPDGTQRALLPAPAPGRRVLSLTADGRSFWQKEFDIPGKIEPKVEFIGASAGRELRVTVTDPVIKRASLYIATADGDAQFPLGNEDADEKHRISILGKLPGAPISELSKLRLELELAPGVVLAHLIDEADLRLLRLVMSLERITLDPLIALVRDKQLYDVHLNWLPDTRHGEMTIDNLASVVAKGLGSRAPRAANLLQELDARAFPDPLATELAWLRANHRKLLESPAIAPLTFRRLHAALLRAVEPRDRLLTGQYHTHEPLSLELMEPLVHHQHPTPPPAPPETAWLLENKVKIWRPVEGLNSLGFNTWDVAYPHLELAFGPGFNQNPDAQVSAAMHRREFSLDIPPAWRAGRVTLAAEVAIMPGVYALDVEIQGGGETLPLRLTHPGNPLWYLVMDGWPKVAAVSLGLGQFADVATRAAGEGRAPKDFEQTLEWGAIQVTFPGAWLPARPKSLSMSYALPQGFAITDLCPRQRAMFTRKIWLAPER